MEPRTEPSRDYPPAPTSITDTYRPGDVVTDCGQTPIGTINAVIRPVSGVRLIVTIAGYHGRYVVIPAANLVGTVDPPIGSATRHVASGLRLDILGGGTYRREMGRLIKDLSRIDPFPFPLAGERDASDDRSRTTVQHGLSRSRLTAGEPVAVDVWHGVVHLHGRIATDAGVIEAMRVAYGAEGVWHAVSTLISDEALGMHLRRHVRGSDAAPSVAAVSVAHGVGVVTPFDGATLDSATLAAWHAETPGLASITQGPPRRR
jgi:hypothetical protein